MKFGLHMAADMEINVEWSKLYVQESMAGRFPVLSVDYWFSNSITFFDHDE